MFLDVNGMKRSDALNKNDGKRRAILITDVLSRGEQGEHYQLAAVQSYTENYARGTRGTEENLHSSPVFSRSLVVDSTPSLFKVITYKCAYCIHRGK